VLSGKMKSRALEWARLHILFDLLLPPAEQP